MPLSRVSKTKAISTETAAKQCGDERLMGSALASQ
jgi:hypothetical protein